MCSANKLKDIEIIKEPKNDGKLFPIIWYTRLTLSFEYFMLNSKL